MLLRSLHIASRQLFYLLVVVIILGLLGLMAAIWLSEEVSQRKDEIADWASQKTGYPVAIDSAGLYWFDLIPKLEVRQVKVKPKTGGAPIITAEQVYLSLDILQTISSGEPVVADASIRQAHLKLERTQQGQIRLVGLEQPRQRESRTTVPEVIRWFSWLKQLELSAISLDYQDRKQSALSGHYQLQQLDLQFAGRQWQAEAGILLPESVGTSVTVSARAEIDEDYAITAWQAQLGTDELSLAPLITSIPMKGLKVVEGLFSGEVDVSRNTLGDINAVLNGAITDTTLSSEKRSEGFDQVTLDQLQGQFSFSKQADSWTLDANAVQIQMAGEAWPQTTVSMQRYQDGEIEASADYLRLSDLTAIALLMKDMPAWLVETKPAGDLYGLSARYQPQQGIEALQLRAEGLALLPWQDYPGANDLSFELDWQQQQGELSLNSHKTTIYADKWLDESVYLESITGHVSWRRQQGSWHLSAEQLSVWNEDLNLSLNGRVNHHNGVTDTDLRLELQDIQTNRWRDYVPPAIIPEDFEKWSRDAFKAGVIRSGYIELEGDPEAFPFDEAPGRGRFDMQFQVEDTQLNYAEGWPDLMGVDGTVSSEGNNLLIESQAGTIAGFSFQKVTTTISNLVRPNPILRVDGTLAGSTANALSFLQNSPLSKRFGSVAEWIEVSGNSDIHLNLMVPLVDPKQTEAAGHVTFADSELKSKAVPGLSFSQINGQLNFDNNGVDAETITAVALNQPVQIDVVPDAEQTRVEVIGSASVMDLRRLWPEQVPDFISGETDYLAEVLVEEPQEGLFDVAVRIESDLFGLTVDAPAPLGKTARQRKTVELQIDNAEQLRYRLRWENWLHGMLTVEENVPHGQIMLGGEPAELRRGGLQVAGRLAQLDLDAWLDWLEQHEDLNTESPAVDAVDLHFDELKLAQRTLTDLQLSASQSRGQWQLNLASSQVQGTISVPPKISNDRPLIVSLEHLNLNLGDKETPSQATGQPELWPPVRLDITEFELNGMRLGQFTLRANRLAETWKVESASLISPVLQASLTGSWTNTGSSSRSEFDIVASSDDLKSLLAYYNYQEVIEARQVQLNSKLSWQGDPTAFSLAKMQGELGLTVGRGSLIEVEPGAAGRIFGLLSIATIPRRLALDFSDLFGKGFDFSSIRGQFEFSNGIARTNNLTMQGDSALIEVSGPIDMMAKTYDQVVKITPKVSSALPLAGAVAGGPVGLGVGTAILLFDKIAGQVFDREIVDLISYSYQLTGPWTNPRLNVLGPESEQGQQIP
ncbi:YhdP family protein [Methylophaga sp.]|uniref:YhdP family protein n=1 Tax=Methylophaga sp. TaxID=2024840 RepID=UPI0013FE6FBA|nr:YhdP family protein [Methylophaga sp.]MTI62606.1 TIGR02099 family protein [Methylophaga sp.]